MRLRRAPFALWAECPGRGVTTLLQLLDGVGNETADKGKILFIVASNHPEKIDPAVISRCPVIVYMGLPGVAERRSMVHAFLAKQVHTLGWHDVNEVTFRTRGHSARDLHTICEWRVPPAL